MKKIVILIILAGACLAAKSQAQELESSDPGPIITDRPDQTEASATVPKGFFQIETGAMVETDKNAGVKFQAITYNTTLLKYGLTDRFELRIIQEYAKSKIDGISVANGAGPISLGTKIAMLEEKGMLPQMSFMAHITQRTGTSEYKPSHVVPDFRFLFAHTLSDKFALSYNLGAEWNGEDAAITRVYTLSLAMGLADKLGCFFEVYGFMPDDAKNDHRFDAGVTYLLRNNFQLDVSGGFGLTENAPDHFLSGGISWRIPR